MRFPPAERSGDIVVRAERLAKAYERPLFRDVSLDITRGQRWALLGPNGSGKTTLLRCLLGLVPPDMGQINLGQSVTVGYFDQQLSGLEDDVEVADAVRPTHKQMNHQQRRSLLALFGVTGDTALQKVGSLSGGERCRAALARLAAADANFLVLDEPTNHLDLWARDALENAIRQFDGTVLFVSHDRYFVNRVADHLLVIDSEGVRTLEGNYDTYQMQLGRAGDNSAKKEKTEGRGSSRAKAEAGSTDVSPSQRGKSQKTSQRSDAKRRFPFRKVADLEDEIFMRETCLEELQRQLADPNVLRHGERVRQIKVQIEEEQAAIKNLYAHWDEATNLNW